MTEENKNQNKEPRVDVHGRGASSTKPDYFSIHFEVRMEHPDDDICYEKVSTNAEKLLNALKGWAAENDMIRTTSFSFSHYMYSERRAKWPYGTQIAEVSTTIYVESGRIDDIAGLITLARKSGASEISDVTFRLTDSLRKAEREKALAAAAEAARFDAEVIAKSFRMSVGGLVSVDIINGFDHDTYSDRYYKSDMLCCDKPSFYDPEEDTAPDFIDAGEIKTSASIDAVFYLTGNLK